MTTAMVAVVCVFWKEGTHHKGAPRKRPKEVPVKMKVFMISATALFAFLAFGAHFGREEANRPLNAASPSRIIVQPMQKILPGQAPLPPAAACPACSSLDDSWGKASSAERRRLVQGLPPNDIRLVCSAAPPADPADPGSSAGGGDTGKAPAATKAAKGKLAKRVAKVEKKLDKVAEETKANTQAIAELKQKQAETASGLKGHLDRHATVLDPDAAALKAAIAENNRLLGETRRKVESKHPGDGVD